MRGGDTIRYLKNIFGVENELYLDECEFKELERTFSLMDQIQDPSKDEVKLAFDRDPIYEIMNWYAAVNSLYLPYGEFRFPDKYRWMESRLLNKTDSIWDKWIKYLGTRRIVLSN